MRSRRASQLVLAVFGVQLAFTLGASAEVPSAVSHADFVSIGVGDQFAYETSPAEVFTNLNTTVANFDESLLGIAFRHSAIVVVLTSAIHVIDVSDTPRTLHLVSLSTPFEPPLAELKVFNDTSVFICDLLTCRLCYLLTAKCVVYSQERDVERILLGEEKVDESEVELLWAAATMSSDDRLVVRYSNAHAITAINKFPPTADILKGAGASPETEKTQIAEDVQSAEENRVVTAFNRNGFTYFVGSARRPNEPLINALIEPAAMVTSVRVTRICDRDKTSEFESRIDLALVCGDLNWDDDVQTAAAEYDEDRDELNVVVSVVGNVSATVLCSFKMDQIEQAVDRVWTDCQNSSFGRRSNDKCKDKDVKKDNLPYHCFIFTHLADGGQMTICGPFLKSSTPLDNCALHTYAGTSYRYGWLEQFVAFRGNLSSTIHGLNKEIVAIGHMKNDEAIFMLADDSVLHRVNRGEFSKQHALLWSKQLSSDSKFSFSVDSARQRIYFIADRSIEYVDVSCSGLYRSCESLESAHWMDPLQCQWCSHPSRSGFAVPPLEKCDFAKVFQVCSPFIEHVKLSPSGSKTLFEAYGDRFDRLSKIDIDVCGEKCVARSIDTKKFSCVAPLSFEPHRQCVMHLIGELPNHGLYNISHQIGTPGLRRNESSSRSGSTKRIKAIASAVAVVILIVLILLILCLVRRYQTRQRLKRKQTDGTSSQIVFGSTNPIPFDRARIENGRYDGAPYPNDCPLRTLTPRIYERLFHEIDPKLKIPLEDLCIGDEIGKGNFGVVYKGTYRDKSGVVREVACKTIESHSDGVISGVSEFLREGLIMANFNHPNVARLIGISLTQFNCPIILTDYLANGDLRHYIINPENRLTFGNLLEFGIQIAEGMSYLHEKKFIHRDLAARNCMLDGNLKVKIADFGLSRDVSLCGMYEAVNKDRGIPIRWMPIESLEDQQYTFKADVWAYGVVLWELATRGLVPYADLDMAKILRLLKSGHRLSKPKGCPDILYQQVMLVCWMEDPQRRPSFHELVEMMQDVVRQLRKGVSSSGLLDSHYERVSSRSVSTTPVAYPKPSPGPIITDL